MQKTKKYNHVFFRPEHLEEIAQSFLIRMDDKSRKNLSRIIDVNLQDESWVHDQESEFFSDIRKEGATYSYRLLSGPYDLIIWGRKDNAMAQVAAPNRNDIEAVFQVIEKLAPVAETPISASDEVISPITVFIGHGQDEQWRNLKDHLHEKHGYTVEAYEIGARAGHAIRDVLEDMLESSSIAFLIMTGEDETSSGDLRARQNVVHEIGLFQGKLGFSKAIVLLEEGVEEFSNLHGMQQIRFGKKSIKETYGDVLATIKREFPD